MEKRKLRRLSIQSGTTDKMGRPIEGLFEVLIDEDGLVDQMERAYKNRSHLCTVGNLLVRYKKATKAEADFLIKGEAFGKPVGGQH